MNNFDQQPTKEDLLNEYSQLHDEYFKFKNEVNYLLKSKTWKISSFLMSLFSIVFGFFSNFKYKWSRLSQSYNYLRNPEYYEIKPEEREKGIKILNFILGKNDINVDFNKSFDLLFNYFHSPLEKKYFLSVLMKLNILLDSNSIQRGKIEILSDLKKSKTNQKRNTILFVSSVFPSHLHGGGLRVQNFIKVLSKRNNIILYTYLDQEEQYAYLEKIRSFCEDVYIFRNMNEFKNSNHVDSVIKKHKVSVIHYEWIDSIPNFKKRNSILQIFTYMEAVSLRILMNLKNQIPFSFSWLKTLILYIVNLESEICQTIDFNSRIAVTQKDAQFFYNLYPYQNYQVLNHGITLEEFTIEDKEFEIHTIVFVGNFNHTPNTEAILFFFNKIWEAIKLQFPDIKLIIVGPNPELVSHHIIDKNISFMGSVPDVRPYIQKAQVCIAPLISGAGLRGKVIEYAALKRTFVATSIAVTDLDFIDEKDFYLADSPEAFAKRLIELLNDTEKCKKFGESAYSSVIKKYDTSVLIEHLENYYSILDNESN
ncbi:MAG: glycosyltransferase [Leptospiraceae bacterium]|nr:glycosyltransferase [Leptospiraceae bacterium]